MGRRDEDTNWGLVEWRRGGGLIIFLPGPLWSGLPAGCVLLAEDKGLSCAGSGCMERFPRRRWSSGCLGSPFVWAPCPATAGGHSGATRSSRGCWSLFVAWERHNKGRGSVHSDQGFRFYWRADENKMSPLTTKKTKTPSVKGQGQLNCLNLVYQTYKLSFLANILMRDVRWEVK